MEVRQIVFIAVVVIAVGVAIWRLMTGKKKTGEKKETEEEKETK